MSTIRLTHVVPGQLVMMELEFHAGRGDTGAMLSTRQDTEFIVVRLPDLATQDTGSTIVTEGAKFISKMNTALS